VKLALVIDVTGSIQKEMNGVKRAILNVIEELKGQSAFPLSALVVFREVSVKAVTSDGTILTNAVEKLKASQGGTCPEASAEALNKAIDHVEDGGSILFVTDASPYEDADIDALIERLLSHNIRVNVLMTGDCTNPDSWNKLPNASFPLRTGLRTPSSILQVLNHKIFRYYGFFVGWAKKGLCPPYKIPENLCFGT